MPLRRPAIRSTLFPLLPFALALLPVQAAAEPVNARGVGDPVRPIDKILVVGA
jgi:hypothetical protein